MSAIRVAAILLLLLGASSARAQTEIVIDNADSGFNASIVWLPQTTPTGYFGTDYRLLAACQSCGTGAVWTFSVPTSGTYSVYARWPADPARSPDAQYIVNHAAGAAQITANQQAGSDQWNQLGSFGFNQGTTYSISLAGRSNGSVGADAVVIKSGPSPPTAFAVTFNADTYTNSASPSSNFGSATTIRLQNGSTVEWGFITLDLSSAPANILSAVLHLGGHGPSGTTTVSVYPVSDTTWLEGTISWNNQPAIGGTAIATTTITGSNNAWYTWDITPYVVAEKAAGRNVISLTLKGNGVSGAEWVFNSREATNFRPFLSGTPSPVALHFVHVDHLNTPRAVYDANQQLRWKWDQLESFGDNAPDENPSVLGVFELPSRFLGQYFDRETNLNYNYFRDYDPSIGRYGQSDPLGMRAGLNTYVYAEVSPLSLTDPFGLAAQYNAPPPQTVPVNPATELQVQCIENCIGIRLVITGGAENWTHASPSRGGKHHLGEAVDFGTGANPSIDPRSFPKAGMSRCACECGFTHGGWEPDWISRSAPHYHFQNGTGAGVPKLKCNMCRP